MQEMSLVFPHQLYEDHPAIHPSREVWFVEDALYFSQYKFHVQKLVLHRSSMKHCADRLLKKGYRVNYLDAISKDSQPELVFDNAKNKGVEVIHVAETTDYLLKRRLNRYANSTGIKLVRYPSPNFICSSDYINEYFGNKKRYFLTEFYTDQRRRLSVMMDKKGPWGGKWTFDSENRKKIPSAQPIPGIYESPETKFVKEAKLYVAANFGDNYGSAEKFIYPTNSHEAERFLDSFLQQRFLRYGIYQDAMVDCQSYLFHSILTPSLNIGLLDPAKVIDRAIEFSLKNNIPINSLEGFVRQVLGWREYIRAVYERDGVTQRTKNFWGFSRKIPEGFWTGDTGIEPLDIVIKRLFDTAYNHHIERLMLLGNFMCLCEFDPDEVYRWFMTMYIDAYDWVMVPNVYGMSQYADGGLMSTKPYISGSNYVLKMSNFKKGPWCEIWDGLFWRFLHIHRNFFSRNPRLSMLIITFDKMPLEKRKKHLSVADDFLEKLDYSFA
jgi:deoxyribodipyrimidine photolyase-related protein